MSIVAVKEDVIELGETGVAVDQELEKDIPAHLILHYRHLRKMAIDAGLGSIVSSLIPRVSSEEKLSDRSESGMIESAISVSVITQQISGARNKQILRAITKILRNPDEFGICEDCGGAVGSRRLEAYPHSHLCVACKEKEENENKLRKERL